MYVQNFIDKVPLERADINEINIMERTDQMKSRFFNKIMKLSQKDKVCGYIGFGNCIYIHAFQCHLQAYFISKIIYY